MIMLEKVKKIFTSNWLLITISVIATICLQKYAPEFAIMPYKIGLVFATILLIGYIDKKFWTKIDIQDELKFENKAIAMVCCAFILGLFYLLASV